MKKKILLILSLLLSYSGIYATHNRAGEITYQHLSGKTYKIIVTTYTNTDANTMVDPCILTVYFGDGDSAEVPRVNGPPAGGCSAGGEQISQYTKKNIYEAVHTYSGDGNYIITMEDPNRNEGICNIPNSVDQSFFLRSELVINTWLGFNSSPTLLNPPIDHACTGECFEHNPGAYDAEGDSLVYSLTTCYANGGSAVFGYSFPPAMSTGDIDPLSGDLIWCSPTTLCQYNIAILIKEYHRSPHDNQWHYIGSVLRDMQINVASCTNSSPQLKPVHDTCIVAGTVLNFNVIAEDAAQDVITLGATGGPFLLIPAATFISTPSAGAVSGQFSWTPDCSQVQLQPYLITFKATDNQAQVDFESVFIRVIPPAPSALTATPSGSSMLLNWTPTACGNVSGSNPLLGYLVYRKNSCSSWIPAPCETGVPAYTGYTLLGNTVPSVTAFTDNNNNLGLINGVDYSYLVVAYYADGSLSYASVAACAHLVRDVPVITNVSVLSTGTNDSIWVHWTKPLATDLDTNANPPPYEYRLMQATGFTSFTAAYTQIASYIQPAYSLLTDSGYTGFGLNTIDSAYTYRVDFYSNGTFKGSTSAASSVFLTTSPADKQVSLVWQEVVPWTNYRYDIYRAIPAGSSNFVKIDSAFTNHYVDSGLVNGVDYCYKIVSVGHYSDTSLPRPLYNSSQIKCAVPADLVPPCQPDFDVANNCELYQNTISWVYPISCENDVVQYNIYFSASAEGNPELIYSSSTTDPGSYVHQYLFEGIPSVAGCYAVTAIDSAGNESPVVQKLCVDNCPVYELPNVFTPNGDGRNDFFIPLAYRYIKDIDFKVYNRWGLLLFETSDTNIHWDGKNTISNKMCSDGIYFYVCVVNEIRVDGIRSHVFKGFVQLFQEKSKVAE